MRKSNVVLPALKNQLETLAAQENIPLAQLRSLAHNGSTQVRRVIAKRKNLPEDLILLLAEDTDTQTLFSLLQSGNDIPSSALLKLAQSKDDYIREDIIVHQNITEEICEVLLSNENSPDSYITKRLAWAEHTPPSILARLASNSSERIRVGVARNSNTPQETILRLLQDEKMSVGLAVLENPSSPVELLRKFMDTTDVDTARSLAANPSCPLDVLMKLSDIKDVKLAERIIEHSFCTPGLMRVLLQRNPELDSFYVKAAVSTLMEQDPEFDSYPYEWVEAVVLGRSE